LTVFLRPNESLDLEKSQTAPLEEWPGCLRPCAPVFFGSSLPGRHHEECKATIRTLFKALWKALDPGGRFDLGLSYETLVFSNVQEVVLPIEPLTRASEMSFRRRPVSKPQKGKLECQMTAVGRYRGVPETPSSGYEPSSQILAKPRFRHRPRRHSMRRAKCWNTLSRNPSGFGTRRSKVCVLRYAAFETPRSRMNARAIIHTLFRHCGRRWTGREILILD
jgi:hypothetical protein